MALHLQEYFGWRSGRPVTAKLLKCAWLAHIVRDFLGICYADAHRLPLSLRQEDSRPGEDGRAHDDGAGAVGRRGRGGHRLLPALLRVVRSGLRGALRVAGARVARGVSEVRDRRRADRRVELGFTSPARYGDVLTIRSRVAWVRGKTFRGGHGVSVGLRLWGTGFGV